MHLRIMTEIKRRRKELAPRCLANPRDFWRVCQLLCNCMEHFHIGTEVYEACSEFLLLSFFCFEKYETQYIPGIYTSNVYTHASMRIALFIFFFFLFFL